MQDLVFAVLQGFVMQGKIRTFGTATHAAVSVDIAEHHRRFATILQLPDSLEYPMCLPSSAKSIITHSIFRGNLNSVGERLSKAAHKAKIGLPSSALARQALLEYALRSNRSGITLFSSTNVAHIEDNVRFANQRLFSDDDLDLLEATFRPAISAAEARS